MADENKRYITTEALTDSYHGNVAFNISVSGETPSELIGAQIILDLNNSHEVFTWNGTAIAVNIPFGSTFTVTGEDIGSYSAPDPISVGTVGYETNNIVVVYESFPGFDLSMMNITGGTLTARETANCYVIRSAVTYMFPLVYGSAIKNGEVNASAYKRPSGGDSYTNEYYNYKNAKITSPYIETDTNTQAVSAQVLSVDTNGYTITDLQFKTRGGIKYLCFTVTALPSLGGNAIIAIKDGGGTVMWSWHLWAYNSTLSTQSYSGYSILNVNLGNVRKSSSSTTSGTSPYYQFGRKDPFLRISAATGTFTTGVCASSVAQAIQNPTKFYLRLNTSTYYPDLDDGGWWKSGDTTPYCVNYWNSSSTGYTRNTKEAINKTVYDPCPIGFVVPDGGFAYVFDGKSGSTPTVNGIYFDLAGMLDSKTGVTFEGAGCYSTGSYIPTGSSTYTMGHAWLEIYYGTKYQFYNEYGYYWCSADGMSVRPIKI